MGESDVKVEIRLVPAKASTPHRVTSRPALALRGRGARAPMAVQATSQSRNKRNRVKQPVNLVTPRLENLSMYSGYTHSTAHKKAVAEVPAKRLIACCWSERMVQITSGSFSRRLCGVRVTVLYYFTRSPAAFQPLLQVLQIGNISPPPRRWLPPAYAGQADPAAGCPHNSAGCRRSCQGRSSHS